MARRMRNAVLTLGAILALGCSDPAMDSPLSSARKSPEALAEAALEALAMRDEAALAELMITKDEYESLLWPLLPDREHMPFEFVWSLTGPGSRKARRNVLSEFGGLPLELVRVDLGPEVERYERFTLYREARMTVRRDDTGEEGLLPLMDVLVEMGGGWKFMNFRDDL
ncbi:MAG: hypothetical protein P8188_04715 [Gemmatimonadota bacterium]|jgi:hypothetical protein